MSILTQFQEDYALKPEARVDLVKSLTTGTEEYYLYRLRYLSQQLQSGEEPATAQVIDEATALIKEAESSNVVKDIEQLKQLETQIALLAFPVKPDILLKRLDHDPSLATINSNQESLPEQDADVTTAAESAVTEIESPSLGLNDLPTALDQKMVKTELLVEKLLDRIQEFKSYPLNVRSDTWPYLIAQPRMETILERMNLDQLKQLFYELDIKYSPKSLEIIGRADTSQFDRVVVQIVLRLYQHNKFSFSSPYGSKLESLTRAQLEAIKKEQPRVMDDEGFVGMMEQRIIPELFPENKERAYEDWLKRMLAFVEELSPKFNRHKLAVYLLSLERGLAKGIMDKAMFLRYVEIPRNLTSYRAKKRTDVEKGDYVELGKGLAHWSMRISPASPERDSEVVKEHLSYFMLEAKSSDEFKQYFETAFLDPLLARVMLTSGDKDVTKWSGLLAKNESLSELTEKTSLKFSPDNPSKFLPSDPVIFKLRVKNAKRILIRVFEVKTFEYLQQHGDSTMGQKLNLDGLTPNWEHNITLDRPAIEMHELKVELPELANRRGAFVMDVISNGENSSAYFTKGCLDFIERQSIAGHVLTIIDENQKKLSEKCSVWLSGYYYKPNRDGDIIIPYRNPSSAGSDPYIYLIHNGFTTRREFYHRIEDYVLKLACHIDHESFIAGSTAKILVKPTVQIQGSTITICPIRLLEQVQLSIEANDTNSIRSTTTVPDFKVHDLDWTEYNFQVPENLSKLTVTLSGKVKVISKGEFQDLNASRSFSFGSPCSDEKVNLGEKYGWVNVQVPGEFVTLLQKQSDGYNVLALGKNGEKRPCIPLELEVEHPLQHERLIFCLRTDDNGQVHLGHLNDIEQLVCLTSRMKWQICGREKYTYPPKVHSVEGEPICLPLGRQDMGTIRKIALFSVNGDPDHGPVCVLDDYTNHIRLSNGLLTIRGLKAGHYGFRIGDEVTCQLAVTRTSSSASKIQGLGEYIVESNPMLEVHETSKHPLYLTEPMLDTESRTVDIQLYNWNPETRVIVIASKFVPYETSVFDEIKATNYEALWKSTKTELSPTSFKTGRVLGEEYQYILNRKAQSTHWAGNLLTKPSVLLTPRSIADTTMSKQVMRGDDLTETITQRAMGANASCLRACGADLANARMLFKESGRGHERLSPLLNFLAHPSVALANLIPDGSTGTVSVPCSALKEGTFLQIFASDGYQATQRSFMIPRQANGTSDKEGFQKRDLRFKSQMDHTKHYIGDRIGINLEPQALSATDGEPSYSVASVTLTSNSSSSSNVRVINSVSQVYDLMMTLLATEDHKRTLSKFGFITDWNRLSNEAKKEKFSKWNCHELNLFLFRKDRQFFNTVVAPYLKNKLLKSFMDDYLIDAPLEKYTALHEFRVLTCMEKCLLAQRIPSLKPAVAQWLNDRMKHRRGASNVKLFLTVMKSGSLKASDASADLGYSPSSPNYSPTDPVNDEDDEESDEDMGFALIDETPSRAICATYNASSPPPPPPPAPMARMARVSASGDRDRSQAERILNSRFKPVDLTKEMAETYYYGRQDFINSDSEYEPNQFWWDLSQWDEFKGGPFLSQNFVANAGSFTDAMGTIALLDVAFRPKNTLLTRSASHNLVISSESPAIIFHSSTKELVEPPVTGSVLVTQQYFEQTEKATYDEVMRDYVRRYIQPGTEFRPLESYGAHVVLMNATPNPMKVHLEVQLPHGSISLYHSLESGQDIELEPHGTFQYEYGFYFPEEGDFPHYPAHVSNYEDVIAYATPATLKVRAPEPGHKEATDTRTWNYVLKHGSKDDILNKLKTSPLDNLPTDQLLPRLYKDRKFLQQVTSALRLRQEYNEAIWSVALTGQDQELVKEYLMNLPPSTINTGDWFQSSVFVRTARSRLEGPWDTSLKYLEYFPLINSRAHKATRTAAILNDRFRDQYARFLRMLSQKPHHDISDLLVLIVYLLAQDRIVEAKDKFQELSDLMKNRGSQGNSLQQLQYDYLWAYLSLCVEVQVGSVASDLGLDLSGVQKLLTKYRDYPVERWNKLFKDMQLYVDEVIQSMAENEISSSSTASKEGQSTSTSSTVVAAVKAVATATGAGGDHQQSKDTFNGDEGEEDDNTEEPVMVDFKIGDRNMLTVRHRGVREITVEYYSIDAETMFSASPLTLSDQGETESISSDSNSDQNWYKKNNKQDDSSNSYRLVKPNGTDKHVVQRAVGSDGIFVVPLLPQYLNSNVMISLTTSPPLATRTWKAYYSQTIAVQCVERMGMMRVVCKTDNRPIRGSYVKVYAEMKQGGEAVFWKDGYTDLVGRFAYALVSTGAATTGSGSSGSNDAGLGGVKRFAVFVDGGREGCVVKSLPVPPV